MSEWYKRQKERDAKARELSESLLGSEGDVFAEAMNLIALLMDDVFASDRINDLVVKRKISVVSYAFNLLWSSWDETLAGRYQTATDHHRSINEAPDFLMALQLNPGLAHEMTDRTTIKVETALRTIKKALADHLQRTDVHSWFTFKQKAGKHGEPFSHISVQALGGSLPVSEKAGRRVAVVRLGGDVSQEILRLVAIELAVSALNLLVAAVFAFEDLTHFEDTVWKDLENRHQHLVAQLGMELEALRAASKGPVGTLYLARTDEEV